MSRWNLGVIGWILRLIISQHFIHGRLDLRLESPRKFHLENPGYSSPILGDPAHVTCQVTGFWSDTIVSPFSSPNRSHWSPSDRKKSPVAIDQPREWPLDFLYHFRTGQNLAYWWPPMALILYYILVIEAGKNIAMAETNVPLAKSIFKDKTQGVH
jgi:hypothetical protein